MAPALEPLATGDAAAILGISRQTVRRWAKAGLIKHIVMPSGQLRFERAWLEEVMAPVEPTGTGARKAG